MRGHGKEMEEQGRIELNQPRSVLDEFSFKAEKKLMHEDKEYKEDFISFDFNGKLFFIKEDENGRYFYYLDEQYTPSASHYFEDHPGAQYYGLYITQAGKYVIDLTTGELYENKIPFDSEDEYEIFLENSLKNDFVARFPEEALLSRYGVDYHEWYQRVKAVFDKDEDELRRAGLDPTIE